MSIKRTLSSLSDLVGESESDYVRIAVELANDEKRLLTYNQTLMRKMGKIASNNIGIPLKKIIKNYHDCLLLMFKRRSRYTSNINKEQFFLYVRRSFNIC